MSDAAGTQAIEVAPQTVWEMVSDVTRMGEWSPETTSCRWLGGANGATVGARFRGSNRHGILRWSTTCTVTSAEPGRRFAFDVHYGPIPISTWSYDIVGRGQGCEVTESWTDRRPLWMKIGAVPVMGIANRPDHNRRGIEKTLATLKSAAESR